MVVRYKAESPTAVLYEAVVAVAKAYPPIALLRVPVVLAVKAK